MANHLKKRHAENYMRDIRRPILGTFIRHKDRQYKTETGTDRI